MSNAASTEGGPTGSAVRRTGRRRRELIRVAPEDREIRRRPWSERLRDDLRTGWPGLLVSAGLHALLLFAFVVTIVRTREPPGDELLEFGWATAPDPNRRLPRGPVEIRAFEFKPTPQPVPRATERPADDDPSGNAPPKPPVKPVDVQNIFRGRTPRLKDALLEDAGGGEATRRAVSSGLAWLKRQQHSAGNWQLHTGYPDAGSAAIRTDTGATALALLAFLGDGHTDRDGEHSDSVAKGLKWLVGIQKADGDFHDIGEFGRRSAYYAHSQATIAVCEALAITGDEELREPARRAVQFLLDSQHPTMGGWKYMPQNERTIPDLSVTGWALMALHSARAAGIAVADEPFRRASLFLDLVQTQEGARYRYEPKPGELVRASMTAEGLLCRQFLGWPEDEPALLEGAEWLVGDAFEPEWTSGRRNVYEWYYTGHVLHNLGDQRFRDWYARVEKQLVLNQTRTGSSRPGNDTRGSWHPTNPPGSPHEYAETAGRLYFTAMCLLVLELPFRHLPVYGESQETRVEGQGR
ncbi:MAG: terpene cyclase/mutase family protein [Planctomycetes bacterium]|nr:terpene cyclase/mutase family protein [Planctomycetota bacterium]